MPSVEEYVRGLNAIAPRISPFQRRMLIAQYHIPYRTVTATQLAELTDVSDWRSVNLHYGRLGRMFCKELGIELDSWGGREWWSVWSFGYRGVGDSKSFAWEMLPEVAEALEILGWVSPEEKQVAEEIPPRGQLVEGATRRVVVNAYERNQSARRECIQHFGSKCTVCNIDLAVIYGPIAQGFVHIHHLKPLSEITEEYEVDPFVDLCPVCPNCHSIIHLGGRNRSIQEVKELIESTSTGNSHVPLTKERGETR